MKALKPGVLILIVAPSGSGKSTLIKKLKTDFPFLVESISYTTRPKRPGDVNGVQYFFVEKDAFISMRDAGEFLEWAQVHTNFYGTSKKFVEEQMTAGKSLLFDLDVQGADSFKKYFGKKVNIIFIAPPSVEELEKRLRHRGTDSDQVIRIRLENAKKELLKKDSYDYCVLNDDFDRAYGELKSTLTKIVEGK